MLIGPVRHQVADLGERLVVDAHPEKRSAVGDFGRCRLRGGARCRLALVLGGTHRRSLVGRWRQKEARALESESGELENGGGFCEKEWK